MSWLPWADLPPSSLLLDFSQLDTAFVRGPGDTTLRPRALASFWAFTRASAATRINAAGLIESVGNNVPRLDHDPVTLQPRGLLIEGQRTNLLLNSLLSGVNLTTQSLAVTAAAHTLSFYGTGTVVLSGAHSATVVGTGAYPARTMLTFTPAAATLTLTVTGTVQFAQLEVGAFASSFIPTAASQVTRVADQAVVAGANFSDFYNQSEGTFLAEGLQPSATSTNARLIEASDGTVANSIQLALSAAGNQGYAEVRSNGSVEVSHLFGVLVPGSSARLAIGYRANDVATTLNGGAIVADNSVAVPGLSQLNIGARVGNSAPLWGTIRRIRYWPARLTNAELQTITGPYPVTVAEASAAGSVPLSGSGSAVTIGRALSSGSVPLSGSASAVTIAVASAAGQLAIDGKAAAEMFVLPDQMIVFTVEA